jgi:aspartyl-tRNA(Asn)/glutamyl-tRNA(Gln) amidotransferase subunit A
VGEYVEDCDAEVWAGVRQAAAALGSIGACVERVDCSWLSELAEANGRMTQSDAACIHHERLVQQPDWFGADVRARLEAGASLSSSEYILARRTQVEGRRRMDQLFGAFDLLLLPTTPIPAPLIQEVAAIAAARQLTRFTSPFNLCGIPALSVPYGRTTAGLPFGIQLIAPAWHEARLIRAGLALQE